MNSKVNVYIPGDIAPVSRVLYTAKWGTETFDYVRIKGEYWLVQPITKNDYRLIRKLTFSEVCYINPYIPAYMECLR
jgi:hypothetical protein